LAINDSEYNLDDYSELSRAIETLRRDYLSGQVSDEVYNRVLEYLTESQEMLNYKRKVATFNAYRIKTANNFFSKKENVDQLREELQNKLSKDQYWKHYAEQVYSLEEKGVFAQGVPNEMLINILLDKAMQTNTINNIGNSNEVWIDVDGDLTLNVPTVKTAATMVDTEKLKYCGRCFEYKKFKQDEFGRWYCTGCYPDGHTDYPREISWPPKESESDITPKTALVEPFPRTLPKPKGIIKKRKPLPAELHQQDVNESAEALGL